MRQAAERSQSQGRPAAERRGGFCGCGFGGSTGNVQFTSYRDPKLTETDEVYKGTGEWVRNAKFSEAELTRYIIGTFSGYERPMSPSGMAGRSFDAWISGRTYEDVVKEREEMLSITEEQFHASAEYFDKICAQGYLCAVGCEKTRQRCDCAACESGSVCGEHEDAPSSARCEHEDACGSVRCEHEDARSSDRSGKRGRLL